MNNQQFRRLLDTTGEQNGKASSTGVDARASSLGTKKSSFIPMTPRTVKGGIDVDFARQVRERNAALQPNKKFKSSAPKGVKYGAGYTDRAKARAEAEEAEDDKASRIKALEEQVKLGTMTQGAFESVRDEITGGDIGSTHLVKGLDKKLLERVRRGEDVLGTGSGDADDASPPDVDEELEKLQDRDVQAVQREKVQKKGSMAPPPVAGVKRSRDEIMAELKAQRKAAAEARATPALDNSKWRKVGDEKSRIEIDHKGRQVLITVDEDGVVKRKVRKVPSQTVAVSEEGVSMPDASKPVLGSDATVAEPAPTAPTEADDDDDDDIFEGVGMEYDPLGHEDDEGESDDSSDDGEVDEKRNEKLEAVPAAATPVSEEHHSDEPTAQPSAVPRNYFKDTAPTTEPEPEPDRLAAVQGLLKKAAKMDSTRADDDNEESDEEQKARLRRRAEMLAERDRDLEDMDMGFGGSRYDDGEDEGEGKKVRLSEWKGGDDGWEKKKEKGDGKKKRKPKKRKGDANNMSDIMRVIESGRQ
jgi:hypothetical protein